MCYTIRETTVTARKSWRCFGCEQDMSSGSPCRVRTTRGDGRLYDIRLCDVCDRVQSKVIRFPHVYLQGELRSEWPELWADLKAELTPKGGRDA